MPNLRLYLIRVVNIRSIKYLTQDELSRLFRAISNPRDKAIFSIAYYHGLRASEVGMIKLEDINLDSARIRIYRAKNSLGGEYPMRPDEVKAVKVWLRQRRDGNPYLFPSQRKTPISRRTLDYIMKRYGKRADIPPDKRHFHVLKHSIATHLLEAGADIRFVQDWLGHKQISSTIIYAQITNPSRDQQAVKFFASPSIVKS